MSQPARTPGHRGKSFEPLGLYRRQRIRRNGRVWILRSTSRGSGRQTLPPIYALPPPLARPKCARRRFPAPVSPAVRRRFGQLIRPATLLVLGDAFEKPGVSPVASSFQDPCISVFSFQLLPHRFFQDGFSRAVFSTLSSNFPLAPTSWNPILDPSPPSASSRPMKISPNC
jgi:hypothetical protein